MKFKVHNIEFERTGTCKQCGECCITCPHLQPLDNKFICNVHNKRHLHCKDCSKLQGKSMTHQVCIDFPNHPWLEVIRKGVCGYKFKRVDGKSMDTIPFVNGKFLK